MGVACDAAANRGGVESHMRVSRTEVNMLKCVKHQSGKSTNGYGVSNSEERGMHIVMSWVREGMRKL